MADNTAWGRRLVVCCDGTWQSSVSINENVPSNITKLCRLIARIGTDQKHPSKKFHQIVYYDSGVGTGNLSKSEQRRQGGTGAGLAENVIEAYNFIVLNYEPGDEIFCFGFSRGAYTARAVAGLVSDIGVIKPIHMQFFPDLYRAYMANDEGVEFRETQSWKDFVDGKLSKKGKELRDQGISLDKANLQQLAEAWEIRPHKELMANSESRNVKVVGVFDTVGSLGVPDVMGISLAWNRTKHGFHNVKLTEHIQHAYQALALDERRKAFRPTLWYIPKDLVDDPNTPTPELKQVWFPGVHINIGGGNKDAFTQMKADNENISTATLAWMLQCISPHLTIDQEAFNEYLNQYRRWLFRIRYACTYHHETAWDKAKSFIPNIPLINPAPSELEPPKQSPAHAHTEFDFSWGTGPLVDSFGGMYHLNGSHMRLPGHEDVETYDEEEKHYHWKPLRNVGLTNEYIHPIVLHRSLVHGWDKHSPLKDRWNREHWRGTDGKARFWWYMDGEKDKIALPEWAILPDRGDTPNFERAWYNKCEKTRKTLDALNKVKEYGDKDFLACLDAKIDFAFDERPQNEWP
ncbi:hypothetical protein FB567DRAFT_51366 [Paraphoma chrysanthemicola]|uniref:T6SS Phospholipase effector Tle1-like catalytic domain-containing protein n=1 Tax=Paraphoma chrysanthemicola TaxID=798071 RepID=A0A8K0R6G2_9PLEO|nr:hypothetical protein FB567DRAFT_51366 [Paraphoma chrysanthemicola]